MSDRRTDKKVRQLRYLAEACSPQAQDVVECLLRNGGITPLEALRECGCFRLAARIHELRQHRVPIISEKVATRSYTRGTKYVAQYRFDWAAL